MAEFEHSSVLQKLVILFGSTTGTARNFALSLNSELQTKVSCKYRVETYNIKDYDEEILEKEDFVIFICSTWIEGKPAESMARFMDWLNEMVYDFRVSKMVLSKLQFCVFGLGNAIYNEHFCTPARKLHENLLSLGATSILPLVLGDDSSDLETSFRSWSKQVQSYLLTKLYPTSQSECNKKICDCSSEVSEQSIKVNVTEAIIITNITQVGQTTHTSSTSITVEEDDASVGLEEEDLINARYVNNSDDEDDDDEGASSRPLEDGVMDMEDLGTAMLESKEKNSSTTADSASAVPHEMVTKLQRKALTKEGYKIIGTHSAVKLCRWTKNQLRGRGGCYKHTFYGITSYQCMEATPSLACANKCVFCWRHHKNPVGTEWRWKTDEPGYIVEEAIEQHKRMINQMRGVPGVQPSRLLEAFKVQHCALSLVGEPIMYPRINDMLRELHTRGISSFLVTNAQFPEHIRSLHPVTQLYVSVDAASKDALKAIDRPLFKDFWDRFQSCLREMSLKQQRTVYRMTLVKDWNMEQLDGYVDLISLGKPDFIEIKAMTYCGKSDASSLTMQNVPWHREVCEYAETIISRLKNKDGATVTYGIATEHEHSCCILLAREDKFLVDGHWHTWIDYPKFNSLMKAYYETEGGQTFTSLDYLAPTPEWALYQSSNRGFDPTEERWRRNAKTGALVEVDYKPSDSGCG